MLASGQTISVNDIGFTGDFNPTFGGAGGGSATGLTDDGALVFSVGTHILTTGREPAPGFRLTGTLLNDQFQVTLSGSPGRSYVFESSTNLLNWASVMTNSAGVDGKLEIEINLSQTNRFVRAKGWFQ